MAANPVARTCACGCGASIDHLRQQARRLPDCQRKHENELERARTRVATGPRPVRYCECGCKAEITHMRADAMYTRECLKQRKSAMDKLRRGREDQNTLRKRKVQHVGSGHKYPSDPPHRVTKRCDYCCGMPEARLPNRPVNEHMNSPMVANENGICNGCHLPYAPQAPIPRGPSIRSSGGTTQRDSMFYGVRINNQASGAERKKTK